MPLVPPDTASGLSGFETLMPYRIQEVVLVSSLYDAFILQEDGQLSDLLLEGGGEMAMRGAPRMVRVSNAGEAIERILHSGQNELVIVTPQMGGIDPVDFAEEVKRHTGSTPVVLLGYDAGAIRSLLKDRGSTAFNEVFLWTGDSRILNSIVTLMEDRANCLHDCKKVGVRSILLVEDSLNFLSAYLPLLYTEILQQSRSVLSEGVNLSHKILRLKARPKILLARDLRSARELYGEHRGNLLGVISDFGLPRSRSDSEIEEASGAEFVRHLRQQDPLLPVLMQSSNAANAEVARALKVSFVRKDSSQLHQEMRRFLLTNFGFGPFRFRLRDGTVETQARTVRELEAAVRRVSTHSLLRHAKRNDFSTWLRARTEFELADRLSSRESSDFENDEDLRDYLVETLSESRKRSQLGAIVDFHRTSYDQTINFARIGAGSLGGKARGIAFINRLLPNYRPTAELEKVKVVVPPAVVLTTEVFDRFLRRNHLHRIALGNSLDEEERLDRFLRGRFSSSLIADLRALLNFFQGPLAVRSSSLLEDSHHQPFAGIYETVMIRNVGPPDRRLTELCRAIKAVYASTYSDRARAYLHATPYHHEEEKMAVVIQPVYGSERNGRYYPSFSGVARSHNYYPHGQCGPEDGVVAVGLGLGRLVVGGEGGLRFCPRFPQSLPDFSSVDDSLQNAQRHFYALPMSGDALENSGSLENYHGYRFTIRDADLDGTLEPLASTFSPDDGRITDGVSRQGTRLVTFANVLKNESFPLAPLARQLLKIGQLAMGCPVELEFAVDLDPQRVQPELALLQIRPMVVSEADVDFDLNDLAGGEVLCSSERASGNGRIDSIRDVVLVDPAVFDRSLSREAAAVIAKINAVLQREQRPYLLIGPGRWGSQDPWLGIPVDWSGVSGARVLVETGFENFRVKPSEGSHFFHNMTSFRVGYFTINPQEDEGVLDLDWLRAIPPLEDAGNGVLHLRLDQPLRVLLDGKAARGAILKPAARDASSANGC